VWDGAYKIDGFIEPLPDTKGVRKGGFGVKAPTELDIIQNLYYLRKGN